MALIRRGKHTRDFTVLPNETLRDDALSYRARGVLAEILSHRKWWAVSADSLAERATWARGKRGEGRVAMRAAIRELESAGYVHRWKFRMKGGQIRTVLVVHDRPTPQTRETMPRPEDLPGDWT